MKLPLPAIDPPTSRRKGRKFRASSSSSSYRSVVGNLCFNLPGSKEEARSPRGRGKEREEKERREGRKGAKLVGCWIVWQIHVLSTLTAIASLQVTRRDGGFAALIIPGRWRSCAGEGRGQGRGQSRRGRNYLGLANFSGGSYKPRYIFERRENVGPH